MSDRAREALARILGSGTYDTSEMVKKVLGESAGQVLSEWREQGLVVIDTRDDATAERIFDLLFHHQRRSRAAESASLGGTAFECSCGVVRRWGIDEMPTSGDSLHQEHVVKMVLIDLAKGSES